MLYRLGHVVVAAAVCSVAAPLPTRADDVESVLARSRRLAEAGEFSEATALLARSAARDSSSRLLAEWLELNATQIAGIESQQKHNKMPRVPSIDPDTLKTRLAGTSFETMIKEYPGQLFGFELNPLGPHIRQFKALEAAVKDLRDELDSQSPEILSEQEVARRLRAIDECGRSTLSSLEAISRALQSAAVNEIDSLLPLKAQAVEQVKQLRQVRATFVSYDHIAPRAISAYVALVPDALGITGLYVTEDSLRRAAEMLGESGRDLEFANKDVKRMWLDAMKTLKQSAGKEQFRDLETLASVVGNSKQTPDQWEPK